MLGCLQNIINTYNERDLTVVSVFGDAEFLPLSVSILPTILHACGKGDHVPTIERSIRTVKDHCRYIIHGLPYPYYTKLMIKSLMYKLVGLMHSPIKQVYTRTTAQPLSLQDTLLRPCKN